jgi:cephalosporin-C deacetylase-like acetyl esterase
VFSPRNPYRGDDQHRGIQRQANPLGKSIFSIIVAQHDRILDWLCTLPNVDPARIGFYGLSYGGKTAMRVPAVLDRYAVSVCSGDFNEWIWKNATTDWERSYMFTNEYEMPEFNLGRTFSYAEMAAMIAPRPFMVERGHDDTVGLDEWVAFEYAKVNRLFAKLKIPERTAIEYFDGPHTIHGVGTFKFLHRHLNWPEPASR